MGGVGNTHTHLRVHVAVGSIHPAVLHLSSPTPLPCPPPLHVLVPPALSRPPSWRARVLNRKTKNLGKAHYEYQVALFCAARGSAAALHLQPSLKFQNNT